MDDPDAAWPGNPEEAPYGLVRPYVGPEDQTDRSPDVLGDDGEAGPWDRYIFSPQTSAAAPSGRHAAAGREDRADEHTARRPGRHAAAVQPHGHAKASPTRFAGLATRRWSLAAAAVSATVVAGIIYLMLPSQPRMAPMADGASSTASSSVMPNTSLAARAHRMMPKPTSHAATARAVPKAAAPTAKPAATSVTSTPSPSKTSGDPGLSPGSVISLEATTACCTLFSIAHDGSDNRVVITEVTLGSSSAARADATWIVQRGLADSSCISFESADAPGQYLRHHDFQLYLDADDGSAKFADDATFCPQPGNSGQGYSFESYNDPSMFIRHYDYVAYIASDGGSIPWDASTLWHHDTTWNVIQPWG